MEETSLRERLIRCPKCENVAPYLPDFPVYQCTACGTYLRAKKKGNLEDGKGLENKDNVGKSDKLLGKSVDFTEKERAFSVANEDDRGNEAESKINESEKLVSIQESEIENGENEVGGGNIRSTNGNGSNSFRKSDRVFDRNGSRRGYFEETRSSSSNCSNRVTRDDKVEPDRENLLRKFEELQDQLSRVQNHEKPPRGHNKMAPLENYTEPDMYSRNHPSTFYRVSRQGYNRETSRVTREDNIEPNREDLLRKLEELQDQLSRVQNGKPPKGHRMVPLKNYTEPDDYSRIHPSTFYRGSRPYLAPDKGNYRIPGYGHGFEDMANHGYPNSNHGLGFDPTATHGYHNLVHNSNYDPIYESRVFRRPPPRRIPTRHQYMSPDLDCFDLHPYGTNVGHPSSCSSYRRYGGQSQTQVLPSSFGNNGTFSQFKRRVPYHGEPNNYESRLVSTPPLGSIERNSRSRPQSVVERIYRPIANGAPFVTCRKCSELLKLPFSNNMSEWKMSCGSCSTVNSFAVVDEKLVSIDDASENQTNENTNETVNIVNDMAHKCSKRDNGSYCSEDFAYSIFDFHAMDRDLVSSSSRRSDKSYETELSSDDVDIRQDYVSPSKRPELDSGSVMMIKNKSLKETLVTEIDISHDDYDVVKLSKDASDRSREEDQVKGKKVDSFFAGILKKSFRGNESAKRGVVVNGHVIPDRLVKKAQKLAGPLYSGHYWYDYRAGFWGVIGGPCLGIIPPLIEEFNYPMPEKCADGNTGVFVNGRELNQKDLDLLSTRGLPAIRDASYIIDINGEVVDENTGEMVVCLGKLAPTVEKVKHGFGMRTPASA